MEKEDLLWEKPDSKSCIKEESQKKWKELFENLSHCEEVVSSELSYNNFWKLWYRSDATFVVHENLIHVDEEWNRYIVLDWNRYYQDLSHDRGYFILEDEYGLPHFYIWELDSDWAPFWNALVLRCDGWIFRGERGKKGKLVTENWTYNWNFHEGKPIDKYTHPSFLRKWKYLRNDWSQETYVAYPESLSMVSFINAKDTKKEEDWSRKRESVVSIETISANWQKNFALHSRQREVKYTEDENYFLFEASPEVVVKLPKYQEKDIDTFRYTPKEISEGHWKSSALRKCRDRARYFSHLVNAIGSFISEHESASFSASWNDLKVKYPEKYWKITLVKDVPWKIDIPAKDFANRLNVYYS